MVDKIDIKDITTTAEAVAIDSDSEKINIKAQKNITSMPFPIQDVITPPIKLIIPRVTFLMMPFPLCFSSSASLCFFDVEDI